MGEDCFRYSCQEQEGLHGAIQGKCTQLIRVHFALKAGEQVRVRTGPGNPGKSLNFPGLKNLRILMKVLESPGILSWATSF